MVRSNVLLTSVVSLQRNGQSVLRVCVKFDVSSTFRFKGRGGRGEINAHLSYTEVLNRLSLHHFPALPQPSQWRPSTGGNGILREALLRNSSTGRTPRHLWCLYMYLYVYLYVSLFALVCMWTRYCACIVYAKLKESVPLVLLEYSIPPCNI